MDIPFRVLFVDTEQIFIQISTRLNELTPDSIDSFFCPTLDEAVEAIEKHNPNGVVVPLGKNLHETSANGEDPLASADFSQVKSKVLTPLSILQPRGLVAYAIHTLNPVPGRFCEYLNRHHPSLKRPRLKNRSIDMSQENWPDLGAKRIIDCLFGTTILEGIRFLIEYEGSFLRHLEGQSTSCNVECDLECGRRQVLLQLISISWPYLQIVTQARIHKHYEVNKTADGYNVEIIPE